MVKDNKFNYDWITWNYDKTTYPTPLNDLIKIHKYVDGGWGNDSKLDSNYSEGSADLKILKPKTKMKGLLNKVPKSVSDKWSDDWKLGLNKVHIFKVSIDENGDLIEKVNGASSYVLAPCPRYCSSPG